MTDLPKEAANDEGDIAIVSLKQLLEAPYNIPYGKLAKAIENYGIYTKDKFGNLKGYPAPSEQADIALFLISNYMEYVESFEFSRKLFGSDPASPLDHRSFQTKPGDYVLYGWPSDDLPDFNDNSYSKNALKSTFGNKSEASYLRIIGALLEYIKGDAPGIDKHPAFVSEAQLIEFFNEQYDGYEGLSQSNLSRKFPLAKRTLNS